VHDSFRELTHAAMDLCINAGIVMVALEQGYPEEVKEAFAERLEQLTEDMKNEMVNIQGFGEAFDDEDE